MEPTIMIATAKAPAHGRYIRPDLRVVAVRMAWKYIGSFTRDEMRVSNLKGSDDVLT